MTTRNLFLLLILLIPGFITAQGTRQKICIDSDWKFHPGHASDPLQDFNYKIANIFAKTGKAEGTAIDPKFDDKGWRSLNLPHDWAVELPFEFSGNADMMSHGYKTIGALYPQNSVGWYRKTFPISLSDSGKRLAIQFDGIYRDASVWLNGFYLGTNASGYIGQTFDITDYVSFGSENVLVVRVDATQAEGWFYEGAGIYRHVWLLKTNEVHVAGNGVYIQTKTKGNQAVIDIETTIENESLQRVQCVVQHQILSREGKVLAESSEIPLQAMIHQQKKLSHQVVLPSPNLWSPETPYIYQVKTIVRANNMLVDEVVTKFGIRTIRIDPKRGLLVNGKPVKIKGVNCHQDHAGVGSAIPDYLHFYRLNLLRRMGVNAYRTSHHPPSPELLDACDSLGILVMDETRLLNSGKEYEDQFRRLILRDRNHPSVFIWSIGNEEGYVQRTGTGKRLALSSMALVSELDPSRTCTYAADMANEFTGINEVIPVRGFNYREKAMADYHRDHPLQPVIGTEMGSTVTTRGIYQADSVEGYLPDQDITAPWWASRAEDWWPIAAAHNWMSGGFIWTGFDYRGEPTPYQWPNINSHFGVMDMCGFPKNIYYYYASWWTDNDILHISPHWNWQGSEGKTIKVWVNSNADEVELSLNGKSLGRKTMRRNSHLNWDVNYEPGILKAIAWKNGREISTKVETTGKPYELVLTPYKTTLFADGKDAVVVNISVIDSLGREVPDAMNLVNITLSGDARIIGVGNGDPSCHEPDKCMVGQWQRSLFNGKAQLILQAGSKQGIVMLEATSKGLYKASSELHTIPAYKPAGSFTAHRTSGQKQKMNLSDKILGADISHLPELEAHGMKFYDNGTEKDAIEILKDHGFNYIRLRIFNNPSAKNGYSPNKGFCDLDHTLQMALRVKKAGMKLLLDFHYSDYWADPQKQNKPEEWKNLQPEKIPEAIRSYTRKVLLAFQKQGTLPDMVQIGNEINHGMIWPEGHIGNPGNLAAFIKAGAEGVKSVDTNILIMLHVALGGQIDETIFWFDNMFSRGADCDLIGLSYYPRWHGTLADLDFTLRQIIDRYGKPVNVVEYSHMKSEVNETVFNLPDRMGTGTFIWEPLSTWEKVFDGTGHSTPLIGTYDEISRKFIKKQN
ncbi:MAG TPA: hypothetical protein DEO70_14540 [Bacteroidales bacterium]|nr:MAG: hypothetical protein A2X11_06660 [Bacteroidetes bacterium GWE2_42_24]OFY25689.1 MAG: hypothetical protein A2X09_01885 [Bacteroidetes bacterium GWF2_43_11]HBZ68050.1 hypothetical protein [Bacteroidales bacterium]